MPKDRRFILPWRENPNRRKSVGDESPNGPVSGSFSYIFALVSLRLGIEYILYRIAARKPTP